MNKRMKRRKILGLTIDGLILISIIATNDITYLKVVGISAKEGINIDEFYESLFRLAKQV